MDNTEVANHKDRNYITTFFNSIANSLQILNSALENINNEAEALSMLGVSGSVCKCMYEEWVEKEDGLHCSNCDKLMVDLQTDH